MRDVNGRGRRVAAGLTALSVALALAGCGGAGSGAGTATTEAVGTATVGATAGATAVVTGVATGDAGLAESMLLVKDDLPFDWHAAPHPTNDDEATLARACGRAAEEGTTARATSVEFLFDGQSPGIAEVLTTFDSEAHARASVDGAAAYIDCVVAKINGGAIDGADGTYSGATSSAVSVATGGDTSAAFQVRATKTFSTQNGQSTAQYTFVFANKGRVGYEIFVRGSGDPMDPEELSDYVQAAASHIPR